MASPFLIVRARGRLCALPVAQVIETMRAPVPDHPSTAREQSDVPGWLGTTLLRGTLVAMLDLGALLGFDLEAAAPAAGRAVSVRLEHECVLLAVDELIGVKSLEDNERQTLAMPGGSERAMGRFDAGFARLLEAGGLVDDSTLAALRQATERAAVPA